MLEIMQHEKYYVGGRYTNPDVGLDVGWWSQQSSLGESMPAISNDRRFVLIFAGEHFSHDSSHGSDDRNGAMESRSYELLRLYEKLGDKFLNQMNGWFCGIAIDLNLRKITLFNDRYGMSRLYFFRGEDEFIFASEAKCLLRIRPELRRIDPAALAQYLQFDCVMGNKTLFERVSLLPVASSWEFDGGTEPQQRTYFNFAEWEEQPRLERDRFYEKFEETVSRVFPAYMTGAQPVGLSLTAGLDTRAILAAARARNQSLPCYTFGGAWGETYDIGTARKLATICSQQFNAIKISDHFLAEFPKYAQKSVYLSDGTHDALGAHDVYFNEIARNIAPIRLTGKLGSEIVRTRRLISAGNFPRGLLQPSFAPYLDEAPSFESVAERSHPLSRVVAEEIPWHEFGRIAVEQSRVVLRTPYMDNDLVKLMYQAPPELRASRTLQSRYVEDTSHEISDIPTNMGRIGNDSELMRNTAYAFYWALFKLEHIYLFATPHWLTRFDRKLERLRLERILAGRQKFEGYRIWMKTHFAEFIRDTLLGPQAQCTDFFDKALLTKMVIGHTAGTHNYLKEINKMLTVELICSSLIKV